MANILGSLRFNWWHREHNGVIQCTNCQRQRLILITPFYKLLLYYSSLRITFWWCLRRLSCLSDSHSIHHSFHSDTTRWLIEKCLNFENIRSQNANQSNTHNIRLLFVRFEIKFSFEVCAYIEIHVKCHHKMNFVWNFGSTNYQYTYTEKRGQQSPSDWVEKNKNKTHLCFFKPRFFAYIYQLINIEWPDLTS